MLSRPIGQIIGGVTDRFDLFDLMSDRLLLVQSGRMRTPVGKSSDYFNSVVDLVELGTDGIPRRECFTTPQPPGVGTAGVIDTLLDSHGRLMLLGGFGGSVSFGGGIFEQGEDHRNTFLAAITPEGDHLWSHLVTGTVISVAEEATGNMAVGGIFYDRMQLGDATFRAGTGADAWPSLFVAKLDAQGHLLWVRTSPHGNQPYDISVAFTNGGHLLVAGSYCSALDFGTALPRVDPTCDDLEPRPASRGAAAGWTAPRRHIFWVELDESGHEVVAESYGRDYAVVHQLYPAADGDLLVTGTMSGTLVFRNAVLQGTPTNAFCSGTGCDRVPFVMRMDAEGHVQWHETSPETLILDASAGPGRTTLLRRGIPIERRYRFIKYRWVVEVRDAAGKRLWSRDFDTHDVMAVAPLGSDRIAILLGEEKKDRQRLQSLLVYKPEM